MKYILSVLLLFGSGVFFGVTGTAGEKHRYLGVPADPLPGECKFVLGGVVQSDVLHFTHLRCAGTDIFWLTSKNQPNEWWSVVDVLEIRNLRKTEQALTTFHCFHKADNSARIAAVAECPADGVPKRIRQAWQFKGTTKKFESISPSDVTCECGGI